MSADLSFAKNKLAELETLEQELNSEDVVGLFDHENLQSLAGSIRNLRAHIRQNEEKDRLLRIGIIGDVKAGKSTFLNSSIFEGKDFLPKAATPMTAALTRISYNDKNESEATVYFYTKDDWSKIEQDAQTYNDRMNALYNDYLEQMRGNEEKRNRHGQSQLFGMHKAQSNPQQMPKQLLTKAAYERAAKSKIGSEYCIAKEIVRSLEKTAGMKASSMEVMEKLGTHETIPLDKTNLSKSLDKYVGSSGKYTQIVSYVELKIHDDVLKGLEIIDTPGLNDPIQSRCNKTKEFLRECNVAILLSPCSQFMGEGTVRLMVNRLPSDNVASIQVVGSQMDAGMMDNRDNCNLEEAYRKTAASCQYTFKNNVETAKKTLPLSSALRSLEENDVIFTSAICYAIYQKHKNKEPLSSEESKYFDNLCSLNNGTTVSDEKLLEISGIRQIHVFLESMRVKRARILEEDSKTFLKTCTLGIANNLETIGNDARRRKRILEKSDIHQLCARKEKLENVVDSSRSKIQNIFKAAALEAKKNGRRVEADFALLQDLVSELDVRTTTSSHTESRDCGLFGMFTENVTITTTNHSASSAQVIGNIEKYVASCSAKINSMFDNDLLNEERLQNDLKNVFLNALDDDGETDPEDILSPLRVVLGEIKIPDVDVAPGKYIDEVNNQFPDGIARNEAIHKLALAQQMAFSGIAKEMKKKVEGALDEIEKNMTKQAATFSDNVQEKLSGSFKELEEQMKDKEASCRKYDDFIKKFSEYKHQLLES